MPERQRHDITANNYYLSLHNCTRSGSLFWNNFKELVWTKSIVTWMREIRIRPKSLKSCSVEKLLYRYKAYINLCRSTSCQLALTRVCLIYKKGALDLQFHSLLNFDQKDWFRSFLNLKLRSKRLWEAHISHILMKIRRTILKKLLTAKLFSLIIRYIGNLPFST